MPVTSKITVPGFAVLHRALALMAAVVACLMERTTRSLFSLVDATANPCN